MIISLLGIGSDTLLKDFDAAGIRYVRRLPPPGQIMNAGDAAEILAASVTGVALVLAAWLKNRPSRKVTITQKDNRIYQAEGRSVAEVEELLKGAKQIMALETKKPDKRKN
jgi:hypothetical protein